jgi:hypothetical protein
MPAFWISLDGVPNSPIGLGVTGASIAETNSMLESMEIDWHMQVAIDAYRIVTTPSEIGIPAIERSLKKSIDLDGIWFPVFDFQSRFNLIVDETREFRSSAFYSPLRSQLAKYGFDLESMLLLGVDYDYGVKQGVSLSFCCQRDEILYVYGNLSKERNAIGWIREIEKLCLAGDPWDPDTVITNRIVYSDLQQQFEEAVDRLD